MADQHSRQKENALGFLNILVIVLSIYVLGSLIVSTFFKLPKEVMRELDFIDNAICFFFLFEFCVRFYHAERKWRFMRWGWIDIISSIPTFEFMRAGRMFRLLALLRVLRAFRSIRHISRHMFRKKSQGAFTTVAVTAVLMLIFSSVSILQVETDPNSNIKTAEDALWWAFVTITTVGYGDLYPVTTEGRVIAAFLMVVGVALLGTFTGYAASWFVVERKIEEREERAERKEESESKHKT